METGPDPNLIYTPGQKICKGEEDISGGDGTYARNGVIYASLVGRIEIISKESDGKTSRTVTVTRKKQKLVVPSIGVIVGCRVTQVSPKWAKCAIISVENALIKEPFRGMIRKEDVRATEKDKVELYKSFRPDDVVLARVISLGDANCYLLSTAENELGVVVAHSEAGEKMVPVSWCEMQCPKSLLKEYRKVARVTNEFLQEDEKQ